MTRLYPRLLPAEAEARFASLAQAAAQSDGVPERVTAARTVFAASGGRRTQVDELRGLRARVLALAVEHGFPDRGGTDSRSSFDRALARLLHLEMGIGPGEASQRQVWAYLALVLLPDVCAWRFPPGAGGFVADRFKGTDLTRHVLARLWWRAHLLRDEQPRADPYWMLDVLGEADLDQIMARRRSVAASPGLVRAVVRTSAAEDGSGGREVFRDLLKRLLRLTAFLDVDWMGEAELTALVARERAVSLAHLGR
ncbi:MAG: hypothetical protein IR158_11795 [Cellulomonas sp.]|uniref:DUF6339 family protein n=1 Tax=Cellulomonas sp. TaxID=40001 RepID=UPI0019E7E6C9|nr:DUF6339 family protein [Cellulomonas sp.]MBF0688431.1 hypothetical protein [Cellulomonas sp.]